MQIRLLMILVYCSFAFAYRIMMFPRVGPDNFRADLTGNYNMNYDLNQEIIGALSIIDGSFDLYVGRYSKELISPDGVALPYPPLMACLQVPIVFTGMRLGLDPFGMAMFMLCGFPYIILSVLCAYQTGVVLKKSLDVRDEMTITATVFLLIFSALMFWVVTHAGRFEFVTALFLLLAISALTDERYGLAGICLGLSLMTKQIVVPAVIVFIAVISFETIRRRIKPRKAIRFFVMLPIPLAILIPFWIRSPRDMAAAFIENQKLLPIMEVSFPNILLQAGKWIFNEEALREFLQFHSNSIILVLATVFILAVAWKKDVRLGTKEFCALVALSLFFLPTLAKYTETFRYAVPAWVFLVLWAASRRPGFPYEALYFVVLQSFIMDHVPVIWKRHIGLIFNAIGFAYIYYWAFLDSGKHHLAPKSEQSVELRSAGSVKPGLSDKR